ncbi:hypothetical protein SCOCK_290020 [Actinacidiphila cocklensis]|uniref:Uncharacterized protein n=1 Tax=Actinacidiphila cocklensis TaxID=887465 RepID=A0A9W4GRV6_9ACTN|nr:hypothetical protein SCOCK_290020 [Actinacidiphila cocklensis]
MSQEKTCDGSVATSSGTTRGGWVNGKSMLGSAQVRDPEFSDRVVAETRALLARVPSETR